MTENFKQSFSIIRHYNSPNEGVTVDGHKVYRQDTLYFSDPLNRYVKAAPYSEHFVYHDPEALKGKIGRWTPLCTCGSHAGIAGYKAYEDDASPTTRNESMIPGEMVVCLMHGNTGKHADGMS